MDPQPNHKLVIGIVIACVIVVIAVAAWWFWPHGSSTQTSGTGMENTTTGSTTSISYSPTMYQVALTRAQVWQSDAALSAMTSNDVSSKAWTLTFTSSKIKGQAIAVVMNGSSVVSADTISFSGTGAAFPQDAISPDQALSDVHAVPGYATASVQSAGLVYNATAKRWYWGIKTATGFTVTVKATP